MFDVSFPELMVIGVVALLVLGPERLPVALRTMGLWLGRLRRSFVTIKAEVEREIGMDEVRRQLHNESIVRDLKRLEHDIRTTANPAAPKTATASTVTRTDVAPQVASPANDPPREAAAAIAPRAGVAATHDGTASSQS